MGNIFNEDFREFIHALNNQSVKYILVGGYSVILHGYSRTTGDMDIWVERTEDNYKRIFNAFFQFGMPVFDMTKENFLHHPDWEVFSFGRPPISIDLMIIVKGLNFDECYSNSIFFEEDGLKIRTINYNDLLVAKKSAARAKDINDLENL
ncbi:nucleotidyltransferase [Pedobacter sp. 22226]|uniref:nucleotidyltransferase n=1 Tax=Pedobacter sp. 22226 TaxID=3453894 RepID=UPI003F875561